MCRSKESEPPFLGISSSTCFLEGILTSGLRLRGWFAFEVQDSVRCNDALLLSSRGESDCPTFVTVVKVSALSRFRHRRLGCRVGALGGVADCSFEIVDGFSRQYNENRAFERIGLPAFLSMQSYSLTPFCKLIGFGDWLCRDKPTITGSWRSCGLRASDSILPFLRSLLIPVSAACEFSKLSEMTILETSCLSNIS